MPNLYWPHRLLRSEKRALQRRLSRWAGADKAASEVLLATHGDCLDGVGGAIVTQRVLQGVGTAFLHPGDKGEFLAWLAQRPALGRRLLVCDLSLQKDQFPAIVESCRRLRQAGWRIEWRDHHHKQWEGLDLAPLRSVLDVLEVNADATESGASLQQKALAPGDPFLSRLAHVIRDRDLWWNKTPDSETLEFALHLLGQREFTRLYVQAPADPDASVVLPAVAAAAQRERDEQKAILGKLLGQARFAGAGATRVGLVYGWLPKNTGLHELLTDHGCALAINVRPNGKVSLRSRKEAAVCHRVAQRFDGGGHPNASGCDLGLRGPRYYWYLARRGKVGRVRELVEAAQEELARGP